MDYLTTAEEIAERLRQEPYRLFRDDCIWKSVRFRKECQSMGIPARLVICLGLCRARWLGHWLTILVVHGWGEVAGQRLETSRPLGTAGIWGIVPQDIRPVIKVKI